MRIEKANSQKRFEGNNVTKCISAVPGPQCFFQNLNTSHILFHTEVTDIHILGC